MALGRIGGSGARSISSTALGVVRAEAAKVPDLKAEVLSSDDPEAIHNLRVSIRRVRSAIRGFGKYLPASVSELDGPMRDLFAVLGAVRDFDIAIGAWVKTRVPVLAGSEVLERLTVAQSTSKLTATVALAKHTALDDLAKAARRKPASSSAANLPCSEVAPDLVYKAYQAVERSVRDLGPKSPPEEIHRLRRRIKRLRYMVEFFTSDYGRPAELFVEDMKELQDLLGEHQDGLLVAHILAELPDLSEDARHCADLSIHDLESETGRLRRKLLKAADRFGGKSWRRLRRRLQSVRQRAASEM